MIRGRIVVFPMKKGKRAWCFSRSIDESTIHNNTLSSSSSLKLLCSQLRSPSPSPSTDNPIAYKTDLIVDFLSNKMNRAWDGFGKAPPGTFKNKIHGWGLRLLSRVEPSEIFLKNISKDVSGIDVTFPSSLNARLVRRRLRHIAQRGTIIHKKYFYGSVFLLPFTSVLMVLPLPNIPFFWILFRSYSHWTALKGSERLLLLASDDSAAHNSSETTPDKSKSSGDVAKSGGQNLTGPTWMLQPSEELEQLIQKVDAQTGLSDCIVSKICNIYNLNTMDVIKYRDMA